MKLARPLSKTLFSGRYFSALAEERLPARDSQTELQDWRRNGYIVKRSLFDEKEMSILKECISVDKALASFEFGVEDNANKKSNLVLWNRIGDDTYGNFIASERLHKTVDMLLNCDAGMPYNGNIYHYHTKLMLKHPRRGGSFIWHQDYGYWHNNHFLYPNLLTAFIAIDPCTKQNGCLQVLQGSHLMGRLEHGMIGGQQGTIDSEKIENGIKDPNSGLELVHVTMDPGDVLLFHCNLLHQSDANVSDQSRYALLAAFTTEGNLPYREHHHEWHKVEPVKDEMIIQDGVKPNSDTSLFMNPKKDNTIKVE